MSGAKLLIVTGEPSGDLHGARVIKELKRLIPDLHVFGIGGDRLEREGVELVYHIKHLAVVGVSEILTKFSHIRRALNLLHQKMLQEKPDACLLIDYPGFNLRFAKLVKRELPSSRVIYYILPQIWAWGRWRLKTLQRYVDKAISILPFESQFYKGFNIEFVGHPLLDIIEEKPGAGVSKTIALLPGSRKEEIKRILPVMLECVTRLPGFNFILSVAPGIDIEWVRGFIKDTPVEVVQDRTYEVLSSAVLALVASGTATLETCILETPMLIIYKVSFFSWLLAKLFVKIPHIGLVNIIAGKEVVPEFIQFNAQPQRIVNNVYHILNNREAVITALREVKQRLGSAGAPQRAAHIIHNLLI